MFISDFIFKKIYDFSIEDYRQQNFKLLYPENFHLARVDFKGVNVQVVKDFTNLNKNDIPTFWGYTKVNQSGLKNNQVFALLKTSNIKVEYQTEIGIVMYCELNSFVLCRYYKWLKISIPIKLLTIHQTPEIKINNALFKSIKIDYNDDSFKLLNNRVDVFHKLTNKGLIYLYNRELNKNDNTEHHMRLMAMHRVFLNRFKKSPMYLTNKNEMILSDEIQYLEPLETFVHPNLN